MKNNKLYAKWSEKENAHIYGGVSKLDGGMMAWYFEGIKYPADKTLIEELKARGYDISTMKFSIERLELITE